MTHLNKTTARKKALWKTSAQTEAVPAESRERHALARLWNPDWRPAFPEAMFSELRQLL
ncbi:MAG: hypothetical protein FWG81_07940 [Betaproteobacteria bacterium]|nr:hypothetical protein [Betaproteobacteria bacterium]